VPSGLLVRTVGDRDAAALGELMERPHAGTIDEQLGDNSDGAIEVAAWRDEFGLVEASVVLVESHDTVLAASLCSGSWDREVWIAYVTAHSMPGAYTADRRGYECPTWNTT
jgi:hypothetical protein